jgi:hypothetical protein
MVVVVSPRVVMVRVAVAGTPPVTCTAPGGKEADPEVAVNEQYGAAATTGETERQANVTVPL